MSGERYFYICDNKVYPIPSPQNQKYKPIPELAGKTVFEIIICYDTLNRRPYRTTIIGFDRFTLDDEGSFLMDDDYIEKIAPLHFLDYNSDTLESIVKDDNLIPLPPTLIIPTQKELNVMGEYMKEKYPQLYPDFFPIANKKIQHKKEMHNDIIKLIKQAVKSKNNYHSSGDLL